MYFNAGIALAILAFTEGTLGSPRRRTPSECLIPAIVTVTATVTAGTPALTLTVGIPEPTMGGEPPAGDLRTAKAIYFITNDAQNSVVSMPIGSDGLLTGFPTLTSTGGAGLVGRNGTGALAIPDSLFGQDSLIVVDDLLFAVNAGSNTLSMFQISAENPTELTAIGTPQSTGGDFPMSVTFSPALNTACVMNGGAVDGVSCFSVSRETGLTSLDASPRPLGLAQTTPPVGPPGTSSDILFTEDSSSLIVTVKGNPMLNNTGFLANFPVVDGVVSRDAIRSSPQGTTLLFGFAAVDPTTIVVTDPTFGAAVLSLDPATFTVAETSLIPVQNQSAICWAAYAPKVGSVYITDALINHIVEIDPATGEIVADVQFQNGNSGMTDIIVGGDFMYALNAGVNRTNIAVMDISGGRGAVKEVQNFQVMGMLGMGSAMGMQVFPKEANV